MKEKIDFVMIWVDGNDPEWRANKAKYTINIDGSADDRESRYRDWDNLRFWFRAVEKFAPWVNKIYFVSCGHIPAWLNLNSPKLVHVKHSDYMDEKYLPTFSSHPIELNLHKIKGISDKFVYFNDDMFLLRPVTPELFFKSGMPVHPAKLHAILPRAKGGIMPYVYINTTMVINQNFNIKKSLRENKKKWFSIRKNGIENCIENLFNSNYNEFLGFGNEHLPVPILTSTMKDVWKKEEKILDETSKRKFRDMRDVSQYIFRYWQLASGNFTPINSKKLGQLYEITPDTTKICKAITTQKHNMICLNDMDLLSTEKEFVKSKKDIISAFLKILPDKSSFEL